TGAAGKHHRHAGRRGEAAEIADPAVASCRSRHQSHPHRASRGRAKQLRAPLCRRIRKPCQRGNTMAKQVLGQNPDLAKEWFFQRSIAFRQRLRSMLQEYENKEDQRATNSGGPTTRTAVRGGSSGRSAGGGSAEPSAAAS